MFKSKPEPVYEGQIRSKAAAGGRTYSETEKDRDRQSLLK